MSHMMFYAETSDCVRLAYALTGQGENVLFLHGWPGFNGDWDEVVSIASAYVRCIVPDLRGFGLSGSAPGSDGFGHGPERHVQDLAELLAHLGTRSCTIVAYDLGATIAQLFARRHPSLVRRLLLLDPPYGGIGSRRFEPDVVPLLWYQAFHQTELIETVIDGNRDAVAAYLQYILRTWKAPRTMLEGAYWDRLIDLYRRPGAFVSSIRYYRARAGARKAEASAGPKPLEVPTTVLWGSADPIMQLRFADRLSDWFTNPTLSILDDVGHFVPQEAPQAVVRALLQVIGPH